MPLSSVDACVRAPGEVGAPADECDEEGGSEHQDNLNDECDAEDGGLCPRAGVDGQGNSSSSSSSSSGKVGKEERFRFPECWKEKDVEDDCG